MKIEFNKERAKVVLRGLKLCEKYPLPDEANVEDLKASLERRLED